MAKDNRPHPPWQASPMHYFHTLFSLITSFAFISGDVRIPVNNIESINKSQDEKIMVDSKNQFNNIMKKML